MVTRLLVLAVGCIVASGTAVAQEKVKVEIALAVEHLPDGAKAESRVDLFLVNSKLVAKTGKVSYSTSKLVPDLVVASITRVEKPKVPEQAVKVILLASAEQAAKIELVKSRMVRVSALNPSGTIEVRMVPVTLRLELAAKK